MSKYFLKSEMTRKVSLKKSFVIVEQSVISIKMIQYGNIAHFFRYENGFMGFC